jgi:hypothetical protein
MANIQSGATADLLTVDPTSNAARITEYDPSGSLVIKQDRASGGIVPLSTYGIPLMGSDYKTPTLIKSTSDGHLINGDRTIMLYDRTEGAAVDTNKWIQTTTTMTITQGTSTIIMNANSTVSLTTGAMHTSHRFLPFINKSGLVMRIRARHTTHFTNNLIEMGFASPTTATASSLVNGAVWRKDGTGQYIPVVSINGSELYGTPISNLTFTASVPNTDFASFEIAIYNNRAVFSIFRTTGEVVNVQSVDITSISTTFTQTHLQGMYRTYNNAATGTAVQLIVDDVSIWMNDFQPGRSWSHALAGMNYSGICSPTTYLQASNYANSAAPASAALSNTTASYTTLGGQWQFVAVAGAETDYALFAFTVPSPYSFYITGVRISAMNTVVAVAGTASVLQWGIGVNSSAVSLATGAPYTPMKVAIGTQSLPVAAAVGAVANDIVWTPATPLVCFPGRFLHVILKCPIGTATATQIIRGTVVIDGYFE